jgi:hypothetical protein
VKPLPGGTPSAPPFPPLEIQDGHESLRRTLGAFRLERALARGGHDLPGALRGAASFLHSAIEGMARPEEERFPAGSPEREATEFEHAFLRMELGALGGEIRELEEARVAASLARERAVRSRLLRRIHRIEVILELHTGAVGERVTLEAGADAGIGGEVPPA